MNKRYALALLAILLGTLVVSACQEAAQAETIVEPGAALMALSSDPADSKDDNGMCTVSGSYFGVDLRVYTSSFCLHFDGNWVQDEEPRADGVYGQGRFVAGQRTGYLAACVIYQHEDPGMHGPTNVARVCFTRVEPGTPSIADYGLNESFGVLEPYPYEQVPLTVYDDSRAGGCIGIFHRRSETARQRLTTYCLPEVDMRGAAWLYQHTGMFVGVSGGVQVIQQWTSLSTGESGNAVPGFYSIARCDVPTWRIYPQRNNGLGGNSNAMAFHCPA